MFTHLFNRYQTLALPKMEAYLADVDRHDRLMFDADWQGCQFIWAVRSTGTTCFLVPVERLQQYQLRLFFQMPTLTAQTVYTSFAQQLRSFQKHLEVQEQQLEQLPTLIFVDFNHELVTEIDRDRAVKLLDPEFQLPQRTKT